MFFTISSAIGIVNSIVAGAGLAVLVYSLVHHLAVAVAVGIAAAVVLVLAHGIYQERRYGRLRDIIHTQQ